MGEMGRVISSRKRGRVWDVVKRPLYHTIKRQISLWGFFFMDEIAVIFLGSTSPFRLDFHYLGGFF